MIKNVKKIFPTFIVNIFRKSSCADKNLMRIIITVLIPEIFERSNK